MIPTKMLAYRGPNGGIETETLPNTRRRKKSTGELFQNGYRVRMGHGQPGEKEDQDSIWYSLGGCVHVISYWGKSCWVWGWRGAQLAGAGAASGFGLFGSSSGKRSSQSEEGEGGQEHTGPHFI